MLGLKKTYLLTDFKLSHRSATLLMVVLGTAVFGTYLLLFGHADNPGAFTDNWDSLGGVTYSGPGASSLGSNNLNVFVRGTDNAVYHKAWTGTNWTDWENLGGQTYNTPASVAWSSTYLAVVMTGTDNHVYFKSWNNGYWSAWVNLGGVTYSAPTVATWGVGNMNIYVRGTDNQIYTKFVTPSGWSGWQPLGGQTYDSPTAVSMTYNNENIFIRGTDNLIYQKYFSQGTWSDWFQVGQGFQTPHGLGVSSWGPYRLDLFATGMDGHIYDLPFNGETGWGTWRALGGSSPSAPAAVDWGPGRIDVFAQGTDNATWHQAYAVGVSRGSKLEIGGSLHPSQALISPSGTYQAQVQTDGNFVVRRNSDGAALWATGTNGSGANELDFQTDGNLVLRPAGGAAAWASGTNTFGGNYLVMQDDGNLVMYNGSTARAVWSWETGKIPPPPPTPRPTASLSGYVPGNATEAQVASAKAILVNNSTVIASGKMPLLNYNCVNSTTGYINGIQIAGTKGSIYKPAITQPTTYTLTCIGSGGSASSTFNVNIAKLSAGAPNSDEAVQLNDINSLRKSHGLKPLVDTVCLDDAARTWSEVLGSRGLNSAGRPNSFVHSGENTQVGGLGRNISFNFCSIGRPGYTGGWYVEENLGWESFQCHGVSTDTCSQLIFNAFTAEANQNPPGGHYVNIVDPTVTNVGVGEYLDAQHGDIYITQEFMGCGGVACKDATRTGYGYP